MDIRPIRKMSVLILSVFIFKNMFQNVKRERGFTLIEILLVIGIISILAAIVIIAINPAHQFAQSRNAQRFSNVNTILNAAHQYAIENNGVLPTTISTTTATEVCKTGAGSCTGLTNLSVLTLNEKYVVSIPIDPLCPTGCDANGAGYKIIQSANGRLTVTAPLAEASTTISVTR
jgi:prepilin-type N-terminal cleavage/methylation domain-containing protein